MADPLQCIQDRFVCILPAASVLPAGVDVIAVRVDDVFIARADEGRRRLKKAGAEIITDVVSSLSQRSVKSPTEGVSA